MDFMNRFKSKSEVNSVLWAVSLLLMFIVIIFLFPDHNIDEEGPYRDVSFFYTVSSILVAIVSRFLLGYMLGFRMDGSKISKSIKSKNHITPSLKQRFRLFIIHPSNGGPNLYLWGISVALLCFVVALFGPYRLLYSGGFAHNTFKFVFIFGLPVFLRYAIGRFFGFKMDGCAVDGLDIVYMLSRDEYWVRFYDCRGDDRVGELIKRILLLAGPSPVTDWKLFYHASYKVKDLAYWKCREIGVHDFEVSPLCYAYCGLVLAKGQESDNLELDLYSNGFQLLRDNLTTLSVVPSSVDMLLIRACRPSK